MAALYLDECVRSDAVALLQAYGHTVAHARRVLPGAADDQQLLLASRNGTVLVTSLELRHCAQGCAGGRGSVSGVLGRAVADTRAQ